MTIQIETETELPLCADAEALITRVIEAVLVAEACPYEVELSVLLTDDRGIQAANVEFRGIDRATDVLSFPAVDFTQPAGYEVLDGKPAAYFHPESGELLLGDILISVETLQRQALEYGHGEQRELGFLVAHSMLHLLGYDHEEDEERRCMEEKQEAVLLALGLTR